MENDGKDEFVEIGFVIDDNGTQRYNLPEVVHGDRFHVTDIDPDRPGLENFIIQQNNGSGLATALFDVGSGEYIKKWYAGGVVDVGRGVVADMDANHKGSEFFSTQPGIHNAKGVQIYASHPFPPEAIWWDADLSREFVATVGSTAEAPAISKFNPANPANFSRIYTIYNETPPGVYQAYGGRPAFWGDILGDWREELLCVANDNSELRIYTPKTVSTKPHLHADAQSAIPVPGDDQRLRASQLCRLPPRHRHDHPPAAADGGCQARLARRRGRDRVGCGRDLKLAG